MRGLSRSQALLAAGGDKGEFEFACLIPGHYDAGMNGVVIAK